MLVPALAVYAATLHGGIPAGDSGELIAVAHTLGTAHPPGYPLWTLLAAFWERALPFGSVALRLNGFSAVCAALAAAVVALAVLRLHAEVRTRRRDHAGATRWAAASGIVAGLAVAFAPPLWKNAVVAEVFALHALLAALTLLAFVSFLRARAAGRPPDGPFAALALLGGLQVVHHHSLVLLWLPVALVTAWLVVRARVDRVSRPTRRGALLAALAFVAGIAPVAWLPIAAARMPPAPFSWGDPKTPARLVRVLARADYGTFQLDPTEAGLTPDRSHVLLWLESLPRDFAPWGMLLAIAGLVVLARAPRLRPLAMALLGFFALQALFFTRVGFPTTPALYVGVVERFYVLPAVVVAFLVGTGSSALLAAIARNAGRGAARAAAAAVVVAFLAPLPLGRWAGIDQSANHLVDDLADGVLASTPRGAVLFVQGDLFHNALAVRQKVDGVRPDVTVVDQELLTYAWHVTRLRRADPTLLPPRLGTEDRYDGTPASGNARWIEHLLPRRPVALLGLKEASYAERYALVPTGYVLWAAAKESAAAEDPAAHARAALARFAEMRFDAAFRRYDPWSFEELERGRMTECVARTTRLLCVPAAFALTPADTPGFRALLALLERSRAASAAGGGAPEDPELVRARGYLYALHPAVRDHGRAEADLAWVLAHEPAGPRAEEARGVLAWMRRLPVAADTSAGR